jgi:CDP-6-deoxy-D-xylo-4-hexulose-3-dehydrase
MDSTQLERALTPKTKMVIAVNVLGNPCSLDVVKNFCRKNNLYFFEDNCESMGAEYKGIKCGMWGDVGTFSTFLSSHMSTMEGGVIVTDDKELCHIAKAIRDYGSTANLPPESPAYFGAKPKSSVGTQFIFPGYNVRPLELCGAIGMEQLKKLDANLEVRRQNACLLQDLLKGDDRFILQRENSKSSWLGFSLILHPRMSMEREKVLQRLKDEGIEYNMVSGGNFLQQPVMKYINHSIVGELKVANLIHERAFFVGNHPQDLTRQLERFHKVLSSLPRGAAVKRAA